jgi:hypothetical protein
MREELAMTELTDTEIDAVSGGLLDGGLLNNMQTNFSVQVPVAINVGSGSAISRAFNVQANPFG